MDIKQLDWKRLPVTACMAAFSFLCALGVGAALLDTWNSVYLLAVSAAVFFLLLRFLRIAEKRLCVVSAVFALPLAAVVMLSTRIDQQDKLILSADLNFFIGLLCLGAALFLGTANVLEACGRYGNRLCGPLAGRTLNPRRCAALAGAVIGLAWLVFFLTFYPAATTIDSFYILRQATGVTGFYTDVHLFTYTLLAKLFVDLGTQLRSLTFGVALFALAHLVFQCATAVYSVWWMARRGANLLWLLAVTAYFAASPIFASLSITLWKDVPFSCCIVIYTIQLVKVVDSRGQYLTRPWGCVKFILIAFFSAMLRHNGFYVVIAVSLVLLVYYAVQMRRELRRYVRLLPALLIPLALVPTVQNLYYLAGVRPGASSEAISIQAQQLARTALSPDNSLTEAQLAELDRFFDMEALREGYDPFLADPVKNSLDQDYYEAHQGDFIRLWLGALPGNLGDYTGAYILQTCGYWIPGIKQTIIDPNANYIAQDFYVEKTNRLGALTEGFDSIQNVADYDFISIGSMFWLFLLCGAALIYLKRRRALLIFLPVLGVWGTLMVATPVHCSFRYIYALPLALPVFLFLALRRPEEENGAALETAAREGSNKADAATDS